MERSNTGVNLTLSLHSPYGARFKKSLFRASTLLPQTDKLDVQRHSSIRLEARLA